MATTKEKLEKLVFNFNKASQEQAQEQEQELEIQVLTEQKKTVTHEEFSYFYTYLTSKYTSTNQNLLDMAGADNVRLTLEGQADIAAFCKSKQHKEKDMSKLKALQWKIMHKKFVSNVSQDDYDMVITHQTETALSQAQLLDYLKGVTEYRYKQRTSFETEYGFRFDLTIVKTMAMRQGLSKIFTQDPKYEVECEYVAKTTQVSVGAIMDMVKKLAQIRQNSEKPVTIRDRASTKLNILKIFKLTQQTFPGAQVKTVEQKDLTKIQETKYAVTDKANGTRCLLYINNNGVLIYLMDMKLNIKKIQKKGGGVYDKEKTTVLDGELILDTTEKTYRFFAFDILAHESKMVQDKNLGERYGLMQKVLFELANVPAPAPAPSPGKHILMLQEQQTFTLNMIEDPLVTFVLSLKTYNMGPRAAEQIWAQAQTGQFPYTLDGLIFTPFEEAYPFGSTTWNTQFKWKPAEENSIDFLLQHKSATKYNLLVGNLGSTTKEFAEIDILPGTLGESDKLPISDSTIVECVYRNDKWVVLKTRADKTIPNFITTAESVWKTIQHPIDVSAFGAGEAEGYYTSQITSEEKKKSQSLRYFNNAVKHMLIHNAMEAMEAAAPGKKTLVDFSCGQGGDLHKWRTENVEKVLGIDLNVQNLTKFQQRYESTLSSNMTLLEDIHYFHYENFNKENRVELWVGDTGKVLKGQTVKVVHPSSRRGNKKVAADNHEQYSVGVSFYTIHYYFDNESTLRNFFQNAQDFIKVGGRLCITCLDGEAVHRALSQAPDGAISGTADGSRIYEIKKKYADDVSSLGFGLQIDVFVHTIQQDFIPEYLVPPQVLMTVAQQYGFTLLEKKMFNELGPKDFSFLSRDKQEVVVSLGTLEPFKALHTYFVFARDAPAPVVAPAAAAAPVGRNKRPFEEGQEGQEGQEGERKRKKTSEKGQRNPKKTAAAAAAAASL